MFIFLPAVAQAAPEVVMELEGAHLPFVEFDAGAEISTADTAPQILVAPRLRGFGPKGSHGMFWAPIRAEVRLDPAEPDADRVRADLSVGRYLGETYPVPVIYDIRVATVRAMRDERLDLARDLRAQGVTVVTGFYFPSVDSGDFHGHAVVMAGLLGVHERAYLHLDGLDFIGAYLGGIGIDVEVGRALARGVIASLYLDCTADWTLGWSSELTLVTDSVVDFGGSLRLGRHVALRLGVGGETTRDSANHLGVHYLRGYALLRVGS